MCIMEQLAHFVTKSFEYNNNRVMDVINMSTKSICDSFMKTCTSDIMSDAEDDVDEDSMDIDITDLSSSGDGLSEPPAVVISTPLKVSPKKFVPDSDDRNNHLDNSRNSPLSLVKRSSYGQRSNVTKNWLISDSPKRKQEGNKYMNREMKIFHFFTFYIYGIWLKYSAIFHSC